MSDSTDNTNELDSYGVWVKNNNQEGGEQDDLNFADSLDLPDFEESDNLEDSDFADMFKDDDTLNLDNPADGETTLTDDELMNITSGDGIEIAEATEESAVFDDDIPSDDISFDSLSENSVSDADLSDFDTEISDTPDEELSIPEVSIEEPSAEEPKEDSSIEDFSFDDITDEAASPAEPETQDVSEEFEIENSEGGDEQEISLDDFMDEGFSDESVASGNNGFAADAAPSAGDSEEVSLDDFVDMSEFGVTDEAPQKEEAILDEKPLDRDISFDSSSDTIQTEENSSVEEEQFDLDDDSFEEETVETTEEAPVEEEVPTGSNDIEAEEVDLSDFGISADAEETPVTQDVEESKNKDAIVDYDLSVGDANMNAAPVVNEIKDTSNVEEAEEIIAEPLEEVSSTPAAAPADNSLLQQIVADLSNLKEEINTLKNNLEEMKAAPAPSESSGIISEEVAVEDEEIIPDTSNDDTGFFSGDDGDDTIALSTDELSNILNTADFNTEEAAVETTDDDVAFEDTPAEETSVEETPFEETETAIDTPTSLNTDDLPVPDDEPAVEETLNNFTAPEGNEADLSYDFTDENLSEPNLDDIEIDEESLEDDLPEEISIPKEEDILVESSSSDFMDSVQDTTDERAESFEEQPVQEESFSTVDNLFDDNTAPSDANGFVAESFTEEPAAEEVSFEEAPVEETPMDEPVIEETPVEESFVEEEAPAEEPVVEESFVTDEVSDDTIIEEPVDDTIGEETFVSDEEVSPIIPEPENDFISHEDENNDLTDSNIDYLTTEDKEIAEDSADDNAELKKDIKSVLLYMDQLLENLPEEKIVEFAKSEEFTTYKKLFSELGLS